MVRLLNGIAQHKNHKVLFDNWFTSPALMIELGKKGFILLEQCDCVVHLGSVSLQIAKWLYMVEDRSRRKCAMSTEYNLHSLA